MQRFRTYAVFAVMLLLVLLLDITTPTLLWPHLLQAAALADRPIYADGITAGWADWSWDTTSNDANTQPVHSGTKSYAVQYTAAWAGFYLHAEPAVSTTGYTHLRFWLHGGPTGGQQINLLLNGSAANAVAVTAQANTWTQIDASLASLGNPATISDIYWQDASGGPQAVYYLDEIALVDAAGNAQPFPDTTADRQLDFAKSLAGVAVAPSGRLYVSAWRESKIYSWAAAQNAANPVASADLLFGTAMDPEGAGCGAQTTTSFCGPESIAVDAAGNLYVAATYENRVQIFFNPETDADPTTADLTISGFSTPRGLALDRSGNLYVVNEFGAQKGIHIFLDPLHTDTARDFLISDGIGQALGVAVDTVGNVYVADVGAQNVKRYDTPITGDRLVDQTYTGFDLPHDLALDAAGNLYVSDVTDFDHQPPDPPDSNNSRVAVIASPTTSTAIVYTLPNVSYPLGLAFDSVGNLYVAHCVGPYPCNGVGKLLVFNAAQPATATPTVTSSPTPTATDPAAATPTVTPLPAADITLAVDVAAQRKPISDYIYGLHYAVDEAFVQEIGLPLRRWGGNNTTRYNWQLGTTNHASDWYFHNNTTYDGITGTPMTADQWLQRNKRTNTASLLTIPMTGYVAKDGDQHTCSFPVAMYPNQDDIDDEDGFPNCGNGLRNGVPIQADPLTTSLAVDETFAQGWITHLQANAATNGTVTLFDLDNEPDIWFETHRDVYPVGWKYDEFRDLTYRYAAAIKATNPNAQLLGPVVNGWTYYWHGSWDGQRQDWDSPDDRNAHGGMPFVPWYLQQMKVYEEQNGVRLLDYLDLHYYPQSNGVSLSPAGDAATQALRLRSTRSLWDPTYADESWIADAGPDGGMIQLIPRMRAWVDQYYPGTKLALTEYNWGGLEDINGALAQADVLGIFGREGLDLATFFDPGQGDPLQTTFPSSPGAYAFRIYRNYDGQGSKFGDISMQATSSDQSKLAIYAAQQGNDGSLTLVVINKTAESLTANLVIRNLVSADLVLTEAAERYQYSAANVNAIVRLPDVAVEDAALSSTFPANSMTLLSLATVSAAPGLPAPGNAKLYLPVVNK